MVVRAATRSKKIGPTYSGFTTREWRREKRQEHDAGYDEPADLLLISDIKCQSCSIYIGRDHAEQEVFLFPVVRTSIKLRATTSYYDCALFTLCGDCARRKGATEEQKLISYELWQTCEYVPRSRITALKQRLLFQLQTTLYFWEHRIPPGSALFVGIMAMGSQVPVPPVVVAARPVPAERQVGHLVGNIEQALAALKAATFRIPVMIPALDVGMRA